jgi:hypothetical protein
MGTERFRAEALVELLQRRQVATMDEMKRALGTAVDMTVFRKLRQIPYVSSYSHGGRFYALRESAAFDVRGLWSCRGIRFSRFGSLIDTAEHLVSSSESGHFASEVADLLKVEAKDALRKLVRARRLVREPVDRIYLYCSRDRGRRRHQVLARRVAVVDEPFGAVAGAAFTSAEVRAAVVLLLATLNEKQRRLFAGLESLRIGAGGDSRLAEWTGLDVHTVAKGRLELLSREIEIDRVRRQGGGRKRVEKKRRN